MLNLIKADLYRLFHRIYLYVFMAVLAGLAVFTNIILASYGYGLDTALGLAMGLLTIPIFFVVMFTDVVTAEENKEHTLKNVVSFGISRTKIYICKNITAVIVAAVVAVVILGAFFASALLLLNGSKEITPAFISEFTKKLLVALLIYVAAIFLGTLLAITIKRNSLFAFAYLGLLIAPILIFKLLQLINPIFSYAQKAMLYSQIESLPQANQAQLMTAAGVSLIHIVLFLIIGILIFKQQEIN